MVNIHGETQHAGKRPPRLAAGTQTADGADSPAARDERRDQERRVRAGRQVARRDPPHRGVEKLSLIRGREQLLGHALQILLPWNLHELASSDRRMAARLRAGVGHRHEQPHSPGAKPGRVSVHQPRQRARPHRDRADAARAACSQLQASGELEYVNVSELDGVDRQFLVERQLISREHAEGEGRPRRGHRPRRSRSA